MTKIDWEKFCFAYSFFFPIMISWIQGTICQILKIFEYVSILFKNVSLEKKFSRIIFLNLCANFSPETSELNKVGIFFLPSQIPKISLFKHSERSAFLRCQLLTFPVAFWVNHKMLICFAVNFSLTHFESAYECG